MEEFDLEQYREQLRRVIRYRLDRRILRRIDESDVIQEVMTEAFDKVDSWRRQETPSVFAYLYQLARVRIARIHRDHITTEKRSVRFEEAEMGLSEESVHGLAKRLIQGGPNPSGLVAEREQRNAVRAALSELKDSDREVLVMRILEGIAARDVGQVLGISEAAVNMRQMRALERLRNKLSYLGGQSGA